MSSLVPLAEVFAVRSPSRTEADVQQSLGSFLTLAPLGLADRQVSRVEVPTGDGTRRRIDIEYGRLIIEVKKDLTVKSAVAKAEPQLEGYLKVKRDDTGDEFAGIITDGVEWRLYTLAGDDLKLVQEWSIRRPDPETIEQLAAWLDSILLTGPKLKPTPSRIEDRLGAASPRFKLDRARLEALYDEHSGVPDIALKRELWARLLRTALGTNFEDDKSLFLDHTLLVIEAEIIAHLVVGIDPSQLDPQLLLAGSAFKQSGIVGVVEADFFDWPAQVEGGATIISGLVRELSQFDWSDVDHDVLKHLYEAVISAETRKGLGEYYTADWLAKAIVDDRVTDPLAQRVLDPACGSGTFVFHAVRRFLDAASDAGMSNPEALAKLQETVFGMDIHPVSVVLARVTYLLAIGPERLKDRGTLTIPVFLGDSVQWGRGANALASDTFTIEVDGEDLAAMEEEDQGALAGLTETLVFPLLTDPAEQDLLVTDLADLAATYTNASAPIPSIEHVFAARGVSDDDSREQLRRTFTTLCELNARGRDHIWGYFVRNQLRPLWLARNPVDVLVGNPPWVAYRFMSPLMQIQFKRMLEARNLWVGGAVSTNQDLAALFIARSVEVFLKPGGSFGFVTPLAVLSRLQYEGFRTGEWLQTEEVKVNAEFEVSWDLSKVEPALFPVPAAVVFGVRATKPSPLSEQVIALRGKANALTREDATIIQLAADDGYSSPYYERVTQGATIVPRVLTFVEELPAGPLGRVAGTTDVQSARTTQEKAPWKELPTIKTPVESQFVRDVLLGSSIAPYRVIAPAKAVLPITSTHMLNDAELVSYPLLRKRWEQVSGIWDAHKGKRSKLSLTDRLDYHHGLEKQLPGANHRVLYSASGNRIAATHIDDPDYIIEHKLYWLPVTSADEAHYLTAILNSDYVAQWVGQRQSQGLFGARDIDLLPWRLAIPAYDAALPLHVSLSALGRTAGEVASRVPLVDGESFTDTRGRIRIAIAREGVSESIEAAVQELLAA